MDFGRKLREARERRGISVRQIASATKISVAALEALERNDISRLPGGLFSRAFVRSYAVEVRLDPESTVQEFIEQFPHGAVTAGHPGSDPVEDREAIESDRQTASMLLWTVVLSIPLVAFVIYLTSSGASFLQRTPAEAGAEAAQSAAVAAPAAPAPSLAAPADAASRAPAEEVVSAPAAPTVAPSNATRPAPPAAVRFLDSGSPSLANPQPTTGRAASEVDAAVAPGKGDERLMIGLAVTRPCWVTATVDGQRKIARLLQPGDAQTIDVRRELVLTAGDAAAIAMTLNGIDAKPLGKAGEVVTRRVTLANFKDYVQTR